MRFSASSQNPYPKNRFLVTLRSFFPRFFFQDKGGFFPVSTLEKEYFILKKSSLACLKKVIYFPAKVPILAIFGYLGPRSKSISSSYRQNF